MLILLVGKMILPLKKGAQPICATNIGENFRVKNEIK